MDETKWVRLRSGLYETRIEGNVVGVIVHDDEGWWLQVYNAGSYDSFTKAKAAYERVKDTAEEE